MAGRSQTAFPSVASPPQSSTIGARLAARSIPLGIFAALVALHATLLRLPYYWDEAGYFIFAARDFWLHGWLVPRSTLANGHPPLLSIYLAAAWLLGGYRPLVTRVAMLVWATALVWGLYRLAETRLGRFGAAVAAALLALSPLCFAQSSLALLDLPVAALIVWALVWRQRGRPWLCAFVLTAAGLMKETSVIAPLALIAVDFIRQRGRVTVRQILPLGAPLAAVGAWFVYYHHITGYWFGNPQFFAYNVGQAATSPARILLSLLRRLWQLLGYDGTGLLTVLALWSLWRDRRGRGSSAPALPVAAWPMEWMAVIAGYVLVHAVIGGAVLARYLLPAMALYFIWLAEWLVRLPRPRLWLVVCAAFLVVGWFWNPPYPFPFEDNLAYAQFVRLHQAAARALEAHPPTGPVWTAWPATGELSRPALGYVTRPLPVRALNNFDRRNLDLLPPSAGVLYLYSREDQPPFDLTALVPFWRHWTISVFHYHPPAPAAAWLSRADLRPDYVRRARGQWVMIARK